MKLVKIERNGACAQGFVEGDSVHLAGDWLTGPADASPFTLGALGKEELDRLRAASRECVALADATLAVPIDPGARILCVGMNYRDHVSEIKHDVAAFPTIFTRTQDSLVPHGQPLVKTRISETYDFEGEIAVIMGRGGAHIAAVNALSHVAGYTCFMDGSVREYQKHSLTAGKNFRRSGAMGPWVVPAAAFGIADPALTTRLNGEMVQSAHASQMIFVIADTIAYISRWFDLRAGDVIATGTPGGVGSRREPPLWLKAGDRIEVEVEGIGILANTVIDERR